MSKEDVFNKKLAEDMANLKKRSLKPGSPEMEQYLAAGYPKIATAEHAKQIIEDWNKDHSYCPWELKEEAVAFLAALNAKPSAKDVTHPATDRLGNFIAEA